MASLLTFSKSLHNSVWLYEALGFAQAGDQIVLIEDAVYDLQSERLLASFLAKCAINEIQVLALQDDLEMRGVECRQTAVKLIDLARFVQLSLDCQRQVAW